MKARMEVLLGMWGRWALRGATRGLGYPSVSPMFRDTPRGDSYGTMTPLGFGDADMQAVDAAIIALPSVLRLVVIEVYQHGGSMRAVGARMGISHTAVRNYLTEAHQRIEVTMAANDDQAMLAVG